MRHLKIRSKVVDGIVQIGLDGITFSHSGGWINVHDSFSGKIGLRVGYGYEIFCEMAFCGDEAIHEVVSSENDLHFSYFCDRHFKAVTENGSHVEVNENMTTMRRFIGMSQMEAIYNGLKGEEKSFFAAKVKELADIFNTMPKTYDQDGMGNQAVAYLHYFKDGMDWHITEKDIEATQYQAYGLANLGHGPELGYISIVELIQNGVELDLYWEPTTIADIKWGEQSNAERRSISHDNI